MAVTVEASDLHLCTTPTKWWRIVCARCLYKYKPNVLPRSHCCADPLYAYHCLWHPCDVCREVGVTDDAPAVRA